MRLEQFQYFVSAVSLQSITAVSKTFFVSPQVVSKAIKQLEEELGIKLFVRSRKGLMLTKDGENVYQYAAEIVRQLDLINHQYCNNPLKKKDIKLYKILTAKGLAPFFTNLIKSSFTDRNFTNKLMIQTMNSYEILSRLEQLDEADLIGIFCPAKEWAEQYNEKKNKNYVVHSLKKEKLKVFMSRSSPLSRHKEISLKTLKELPLIGYYLDTKPIFEKDLRELYGVKINYEIEVDNIALCLDLIESNNGYAIGLDLAFQDILTAQQKVNIISIPLEIDYKYDCLILVHEKKMHDDMIQQFIETVKMKYNSEMI